MAVEQKEFITDLDTILRQVRDVLISKNRKYGDSALTPVRVFSDADNVAQINVRMDDKLSRMANQQADDDKDAELDLLGYMLLKRIALLRKARNP